MSGQWARHLISVEQVPSGCDHGQIDDWRDREEDANIEGQVFDVSIPGVG